MGRLYNEHGFKYAFMYQNTKQHVLQSLLNSKVSNMQVTGRMFETN